MKLIRMTATDRSELYRPASGCYEYAQPRSDERACRAADNNFHTLRTNPMTSYTQGSVLFGASDGTITQDNANFFWDDTNFRLGIGTTTPALAIDALNAS